MQVGTGPPTVQPCISCKQRRIVCDRVWPACLRCEKDGIDCPGYIKIKQWKPPMNTYELLLPAPSAVPKNIQATGPEHADEDVQLHVPVVTAAKGEPKPQQLYIPSWLSTPDRTGLMLASCVEYFNQRMIPSVTPARLPFRRQPFEVDFWRRAPALMQELFIVIVRTGQSAARSADPSSDLELCHYRASSLAELKKTISGTLSEPVALVLSSIFMLMFADLQYPSSGSWMYHARAARRIILLRGGFSQAMRELQAQLPPALMINYLMVDIFNTSATLITSWHAESVIQQMDYIDFLSENGEMLLAHAHGCPPTLIKAVLYTNVMRANESGSANETCGTEAPSVSLSGILELISSFDAEQWANRVPFYGRRQPQKREEVPSVACISAWTTLALCYRSAALLYALLSSPGDIATDFTETIISAKHGLTSYMHSLLLIRSDNLHDPVETQLWRLLPWPMIVSAYVRIGWGIGEESVEVELARFAACKGYMAPTSPWYVDGLLQGAIAKREDDTNKIWRWHDGLSGPVMT